jgi:hypothetical protein
VSITFVNGSVPTFVTVAWMVIADPSVFGVFAPSTARAAWQVFRPTGGPPGRGCHEGSSVAPAAPKVPGQVPSAFIVANCPT